jgi:succinate-semialdehyde dehydrogenase/glutarate-semialdehyde dehydrogenase
MDMMINGKHARAKESFDVLNPATLERVGTAPRSGPAELERAVTAAREAQKAWRRQDVAARREALRKGAALIRESLPEIARILTAEQGKPLAEAMMEVGIAASFFESRESRLRGRPEAGRRDSSALRSGWSRPSPWELPARDLS